MQHGIDIFSSIMNSWVKSKTWKKAGMTDYKLCLKKTVFLTKNLPAKFRP